ncbi:MAG: three-Cys-motif partner protein TcmP [Verrucomicrobiota bacterium]
MPAKPLPPHSEAKIRLLKAYLEAYLNVIGHDQHTDRVFLADLFCGPGMYQGGKPGSPVEIGRMLAGLHKRHLSAPKTEFLFNDVDVANVSNVEGYLRPLEAAHPKIKLIASSKSVADLIPELLSEQVDKRLRSKRFYFVDPFGYSQITLSEILSLLHVDGTELLLFQPCSFMFRFSEKGTPESLSGFMEELSRGKPWPQGLNIMGYIQHTKRLLRERLEGTHYVDSFTIQKDAQTVFCLFFFTKHIRGFEKMLEAKWRFNGETGQGWHYSAGTGVGDLFNKPTPQTQILERALEVLLADGRLVTNADIYRETLEQGFLPKHSNEILTAWQKAGRIRVEPVPPRSGVFYLGYEEHVKKGRIVQISKVS